MISFVYGGSGSGKSEYAESTVLGLSDMDNRYYIATMIPGGEEGAKRVRRHQTLRAGKGFRTIECPVDICAALREIDMPSRATILLECVSNLAANEMFEKPGMEEDAAFAERIADEVMTLCSGVANAVVVSNNVFEDGMEYDALTVQYTKRLGMINCRIAAMADSVTEIVAGIPVKVR